MDTINITAAITAVHPGPLGGGIFTGTDRNGRRYRFIATSLSLCRTPAGGEIWTLSGRWEQHEQYGRQVRVVSGQLTKPSGKLIIRYLAIYPAFRGIGIGEKIARKLWDHFGESLYSILDHADEERLCEVLPIIKAEALVTTWQKTKLEAELIAFLDRHDISISFAETIRRLWPENAIAKIQENPYRMLALTSWEKADRLARSMGIALDDPRRITAAAEAALYRRLDAKHTLSPPHELGGIVSRLLYPAVIKPTEAIELAITHKAIAKLGDAFQPCGAAIMEDRLESYFARMLSIKGHRNVYLDEMIADYERQKGFALTPEQKAAVALPFRHNLSVLLGGAGTGKTTVLEAIHHACERAGVEVLQMALAGRAAQRMRDATGRVASTIARFLYHPESARADRLNDDSVVIIDESSMLGLPLVYRLIKALPCNPHLLFVGDPYQLPPIEFGMVFQPLARSGNVPRVELKTIHRHSDESGIAGVAFQIRNGIVPEIESYYESRPGVTFMECSEHDITNSVVRISEQLEDDLQILAVRKARRGGVKEINEVFHALLPHSKSSALDWSFHVGEPVMYTRNDYRRELWNGSLGRVKEIIDTEPKALRCTFDVTNVQTITAQMIDHLELAYAITVHKAQGSQFRKVIIPVVNSPNLLDRTLLYTAITRSIDQVVLVGNRSLFESAVKAKPFSHERMIGFAV
ncbi:MAG: ATP-dependent RecD-like DNA helicase [Nitrososphaera sp.]|nr:ATP-dependent RecD-like DNA helicase [Nitrososphaera sp.]